MYAFTARVDDGDDDDVEESPETGRKNDGGGIFPAEVKWKRHDGGGGAFPRLKHAWTHTRRHEYPFHM